MGRKKTELEEPARPQPASILETLGVIGMGDVEPIVLAAVLRRWATQLRQFSAAPILNGSVAALSCCGSKRTCRRIVRQPVQTESVGLSQPRQYWRGGKPL
jgi:hypothetical protein